MDARIGKIAFKHKVLRWLNAAGRAIHFIEHGEGRVAVHLYEDLVELARICVKQSKTAANQAVSNELMKLAKEYQARAAALDGGVVPHIGEER